MGFRIPDARERKALDTNNLVTQLLDGLIASFTDPFSTNNRINRAMQILIPIRWGLNYPGYLIPGLCNGKVANVIIAFSFMKNAIL